MTSRHYGIEELDSILAIEAEYGPLTYQKPFNVDVEHLHLERTGVRRRAACLYMAAWRLRRGYYDNILRSRMVAA